MKINQSPIRFGFFALLLAEVLTACPSTNSGGGAGGGSGGGSGGGGGGGDSLTLSGKIADWPATKTGSLRIVVGSTLSGSTPVSGTQVPVNANGDFSSLAFPDAATIAPALAFQGVVLFSCRGVNAKLGLAIFFVQNASNVSTGLLLEGTSNSSNAVVGDKQFFRVYSDMNTTVSGACSDNDSTRTYNVELIVGWNIVIQEFTAIKSSISSFSFTSGVLPSDAKFFYIPNGNSLTVKSKLLLQ